MCFILFLALRVIHPCIAIDPKLVSVHALTGLPQRLRLRCHATDGEQGGPTRGYAALKRANDSQHPDSEG